MKTILTSKKRAQPIRLLISMLIFTVAGLTQAQQVNPNNVGIDGEPTMTLTLLGYIPKLPAFNIKVALVSPANCTKDCQRSEWVLTEGTKLLNSSNKKVALKTLSPNKEYLVDWVRSDAVQPKIIDTLKLAKQ